MLRILSISVAYDSAIASAISIERAASAVVAEKVMIVAELFMKLVVVLEADFVPDVYTATESCTSLAAISLRPTIRAALWHTLNDFATSRYAFMAVTALAASVKVPSA